VVKPRRTGIYAVAERAGVSIATVSRVMGGSTTVNAQMAERVRAAAAELGYRPNNAARGLASGQHQTIGVVVPDITNPYFSHVVQAMSVGSEGQGYRMMVGDSRLDPDEELRVVESICGQVDALALVGSRMKHEDLRKVAELDVPAVLVNRIELGIDMPMVAVDNFSAMLEICHHLVGLGHRRAVYLAGPEESWQNRERWRAVRQARILGLEAEVVETDGTLESGHEVLAQALERRPTALICFNDLVAVGAVAALRERGLSVPGDLSVTGFDDSVLARYSAPTLTSAQSPMQELGEQAWRLLAAALDGKRLEDVPLLEALVVQRESTGAAPTEAAAS
jgi:LacI family transcriptional regulator